MKNETLGKRHLILMCGGSESQRQLAAKCVVSGYQGKVLAFAYASENITKHMYSGYFRKPEIIKSELSIEAIENEYRGFYAFAPDVKVKYSKHINAIAKNYRKGLLVLDLTFVKLKTTELSFIGAASSIFSLIMMHKNNEVDVLITCQSMDDIPSSIKRHNFELMYVGG